MNWHQKNIEEVFHELHSSSSGITEEESRIRIERFGLNVLKEKKKKTLFMIFLDTSCPQSSSLRSRQRK